MANLPLTEFAVPDYPDDIFVIGGQERADITTLQNAVAALEETTEGIPTGTFPDLTAGSILSESAYSKDTTPYLYRAMPYVSKRLEDVLVGGSVVWNQLCTDTIIGWIKGNATMTKEGDAFKLVPTVGNATAKFAKVTLVANHVYIASGKFKSDGNGSEAWFGFFKESSNGEFSNSSFARNSTSNYVYATIMFKANETPYFAIRCANNMPTTSYMMASNVNCIDLTAMFGSTIADYVYTLEQSVRGSGIAWLKARGFFTKPYYAYDTGTIKSVEATAHVTVGKNLYDKSKTNTSNGYRASYYVKGSDGTESSSTTYNISEYFRVLPNTEYTISGTYGTQPGICFYDGNKNFISGLSYGVAQATPYKTFTTPSNAVYARCSIVASLVDELQLEIGGTQTAYKPYEAHTYPLGDVTLRGIPKLVNNELVYDGDIYKYDGAVTRKYVLVDVSTLTFTTRYTGNTKKLVSANIGSYYNVADPGVMGEKYPYIGSIAGASVLSDVDNATYGCYTYNGGTHDYSLYIVLPKDETPSGYVLYKAETPTTETTTPFEQYQICTTGGTEEYTTTNDVPVGHDTKYFTDVIGNIEDIPAPPTADGTYTLKVTVSSGVPTYAWV